MVQLINLLGFYVKDPVASAAFYQTLGFKPLSAEPTLAKVILGDMQLQFIAQDTAKDQPENFQKEAFGEPKGTGLYINVQVRDVDAVFRLAQEAGLKPSSEPRDWPWGQREFVLRDPDGYKLVFYRKIATS